MAKTAIVVCAVLLGLAACANLYINFQSNSHLFSKLQEVPSIRVGLVLGTSERLAGGGANPFFTARISAAASLYLEGKVQILLLSGDASTPYYNEPAMMRRALLEAGIPAHAIWLDGKGYRTIDSILRCRQIFGQNRCIVVSQRFHNQRAVFLARMEGLDAIGYNAEDVTGLPGAHVHLREFFAKALAFWELSGSRRYQHEV